MSFSLKAMLQININTIEIVCEVQVMDHLIGYVGLAPLTHAVSFQPQETNAKSVNVGRNRILLNLQKAWDIPYRGYPILLISMSLFIALCLLCWFAGDYTTQGG